MDFIKIPYYINEDRVGDAVIRISDIRCIVNNIDENENIYARVSRIGGGFFNSPMSVAEIYDLIKQNIKGNETSN